MFASIMTPRLILERLARELYGQMTQAQQKDSQGLAHWFRGADFALPCAPV
ncbi:MAG: hypothetical protein ABIH03_04715 [Pseudomonadota bacterium]